MQQQMKILSKSLFFNSEKLMNFMINLNHVEQSEANWKRVQDKQGSNKVCAHFDYQKVIT
jgi:hypothetical protein